jgi:hypothetical protein
LGKSAAAGFGAFVAASVSEWKFDHETYENGGDGLTANAR